MKCMGLPEAQSKETSMYGREDETLQESQDPGWGALGQSCTHSQPLLLRAAVI